MSQLALGGASGPTVLADPRLAFRPGRSNPLLRTAPAIPWIPCRVALCRALQGKDRQSTPAVTVLQSAVVTVLHRRMTIPALRESVPRRCGSVRSTVGMPDQPTSTGGVKARPAPRSAHCDINGA